MKSLWLKRRWWLLAVFGLIVVAAISAATYLSSPAHGRQTGVDIKLKTAKAAAKLAPTETIDNQYFQLGLPAGYKVTAQSATVSGLLWSVTIIKSDAEGSQVIAISLKNFSGDLSSDPSYGLRQRSPDYQLRNLNIEGRLLPAFVKNGSGEVVAFWNHQRYLATIAVSQYSASDPADCLQTLSALLSVWQWHS